MPRMIIFAGCCAVLPQPSGSSGGGGGGGSSPATVTVAIAGWTSNSQINGSWTATLQAGAYGFRHNWFGTNGDGVFNITWSGTAWVFGFNGNLGGTTGSATLSGGNSTSPVGASGTGTTNNGDTITVTVSA